MKKSDFRPGFKISEKQYFYFWRMWRQALAVQRWDGLRKDEQDVKRYEMLGRAGFASLKEVDHLDGFARVKRELMLLQDRVVNEPEDADQRRRYLHKIGELGADLAELLGEGAAVYLQKILQERFKRFAGLNTIADLMTEELRQVVMTLEARLKALRETPEPALVEEPF